ATAAAVVLASGPAAAPPQPPGSPGVKGRRPARRRVAAGAPAKTAEYWHVKRAWIEKNLEPGMAPRVIETWTSRTGREWTKSPRSGGRLVEASRPGKFSLGDIELSLDEVRALPTGPDALEKRLAEIISRADLRSPAGTTPDADGLRRLGFLSLVALITTAPASPDVRAAAFRAIAAHPDVRSNGEVEGGHELRFPAFEPLPRGAEGAAELPKPEARLVVDPSTGRVTRTNFFVQPGGGLEWVAPPSTMAITANWTDDLPED
ncbi:hypothetical protein BJF79_25240, partial [Actinomadura sp. CNU-125]|uniref:hypothetical protein n=1 Tax=Actinomadura sp. CNU-125 TaxID=1904961 RepID=UPI00095C6BA9